MSRGSFVWFWSLSVILMIIAALLGSGVIDVPDSPPSPDDPIIPDDPEDYPFDNVIPDGFTLDLEENVLSAGETVMWHVFDMYTHSCRTVTPNTAGSM